MKQLYPVVQDGVDPLSIYDDLDLPAGAGDRPFVGLNMVTSIDGKITFRLNERKEPIGSAIDRALMKRLRANFDAVLRGAETVRANPHWPDVSPEGVQKRVSMGWPPQPYAVVLTRGLDLPWDSPFFADPERVIIITTEHADAQRLERARKHAHVVQTGTGGVDIRAALSMLYERFGIVRLLAEGGGALNYHLARDHALDEIFWTLAPKLSGFAEDKTMFYGEDLLQPTPMLRLKSLYVYEDELYQRWSLLRDGS